MISVSLNDAIELPLIRLFPYTHRILGHQLLPLLTLLLPLFLLQVLLQWDLERGRVSIWICY
jgi:hypothetical protein